MMDVRFIHMSKTKKQKESKFYKIKDIYYTDKP